MSYRKPVPNKNEQYDNEPILTSKEINLGLPEFAKPFLFVVDTIDIVKEGDLKYGPYMVLRLKNSKWPNNLIRKKVSLRTDETGALDARETLILANMFDIDSEDDWKTNMLGENISIMLKVAQTKNENDKMVEARTKDGYQIIGCDILTPEEFAEMDDTQTEQKTETKKADNPETFQCWNCKKPYRRNEVTMLDDGHLYCKECCKEHLQKPKVAEIFRCDCGKNVKTANKEKHIKSNHKMFTVN